jgi:ATP-dependent RNA helicase HelY
MYQEVHIGEVVSELERDNLLPAIVFRTSRAQCDQDSRNAGNTNRLKLTVPKQHQIKEFIDAVITKYDMDRDLVTTHPQYNSLVNSGVGAHHAGQLLIWRLLLEELMSAGLLRVLVATGTVAAGVDFPARTVVITADSKRGSDGFKSLTASEFQQMSGRAGRRGKDTVGFCIAAPAKFCNAETVLKISNKKPEALVSAYYPSPSTVLNLLRYRNADDLRYTVQRSLASFMDKLEAKEYLAEAQDLEDNIESANLGDSAYKKRKKRIKRLRTQAEAMERKQVDLLDMTLKGLNALGYLEGTGLSAKGFWAAQLCTSLVLELAEAIDSGIFEGGSAEDFAAIIAAITADEYRTYLDYNKDPLTPEMVKKLEQILKKVSDVGLPGVSENKKVVLSASYTVLVWMQSKDWQEFRSLLELFKVAEGDAARLITQTAEQLNQINRLYESHPKLALVAETARRLLLRPPLTEVINLDF